MKLALDFDDTFTRDPFLWVRFIQNAKEIGHEVLIVTARDSHNDGIKWRALEMTHSPAPVIWCDGRPKKAMCEAHGVHIDVWIDDNPRGIHSPSFFTPEDLLAWRQQDRYRGATTPPHGKSRGFTWGKNND